MSELASQGAQSKLLMDAATPFDASSEPYEFLSESLTKQSKVLYNNGIRGTRSHPKELLRDGNYTVSGNIRMNVSPADMDNLLPRILGTAGVLTEALPSFAVLIQRGPAVATLANAFTYAGCYVNTATFKGQAGGLIELDMNIIGTTEAVAAASTLAAALALEPGITAAYAPFRMSDAVLTLGGAPYDMMDFELTIDNKLDARFTNSVTATSITPQDREVRLKLTTPLTITEDTLYDKGAAGVTGASSIALTNGAISTTFAMVHLAGDNTSPTVGGKTEVPLVLNFMAYKSGDTAELIVTNDSTP